jgi:oligopeptide transport system permease protein
MSADYVRTARAKGLDRRGAAMRHAFRNAFLPVLSYLGPATAFAVTGSFVVERVFAVPGIGQHFVAAVLSKDITLLLGTVLVFGTAVVLMNLAVDVLYAWVDPRIQVTG